MRARSCADCRSRVEGRVWIASRMLICDQGGMCFAVRCVDLSLMVDREHGAYNERDQILKATRVQSAFQGKQPDACLSTVTSSVAVVISG